MQCQEALLPRTAPARAAVIDTEIASFLRPLAERLYVRRSEGQFGMEFEMAVKEFRDLGAELHFVLAVSFKLHHAQVVVDYPLRATKMEMASSGECPASPGQRPGPTLAGSRSLDSA